ncbi:MAG: CDP-glucose 4,6-dehydratase [Methanoregula sp.]|nr:CDP-glucose 4,6-dehydratase [Methanoregula sp.]
MTIHKKLIDAYRGRTVLVTGHTGFKGSWLALWLESLGAKVIGYSLDPPSDPSVFQVTGLSDRIIDIRGDILDTNKMFETVKKYRPEFIFHLAAQPLVRHSYVNPLDTFNVNILGTANILEAIRLSQYPTTCVCITSDKCYENREWDYAYRENDPLGGYDPYSASKGAAEIVIASYRNSFFNSNNPDQIVSLSSARAGNVIGGGEWADDRIVPDSVRALVKKIPVEIRNPHAIRPWQFVLDPLFGYLWLALKMKENPKIYADAWNFGPNHSNAVDVQTLMDKILLQWGSGTWKNMSYNEIAPHEASYLKLDIAKSMTRLGWKPVYDIDEAISKTIQWYKLYYSGNGDMYKFSLGQIQSFMQESN